MDANVHAEHSRAVQRPDPAGRGLFRIGCQNNGTTGRMESVVTKRGSTKIQEDDYTYPTPGKATSRDRRIQVQVLEVLDCPAAAEYAKTIPQ